jgi:hypothetical protein
VYLWQVGLCISEGKCLRMWCFHIPAMNFLNYLFDKWSNVGSKAWQKKLLIEGVSGIRVVRANRLLKSLFFFFFFFFKCGKNLKKLYAKKIFWVF